MQNIQSKVEIAVTSPTTWTLVATVVYNALNANANLIPQDWSAAVNVLLLLLACYLHTSHVQSAAALGSTKV